MTKYKYYKRNTEEPEAVRQIFDDCTRKYLAEEIEAPACDEICIVRGKTEYGNDHFETMYFPAMRW